MSTYSVIDIRADLQLAALRDSVGRKYVVRLSADLPDIGAELASGVLGPATRVTLRDHTGHVFEATVDASECTEQYLLERLHATADRVAPGSAAAPGHGAPARGPPPARAGVDPAPTRP